MVFKTWKNDAIWPLHWPWKSNLLHVAASLLTQGIIVRLTIFEKVTFDSNVKTLEVTN